jgi:hypothetical protein
MWAAAFAHKRRTDRSCAPIGELDLRCRLNRRRARCISRVAKGSAESASSALLPGVGMPKLPKPLVRCNEGFLLTPLLSMGVSLGTAKTVSTTLRGRSATSKSAWSQA